MSTPKVQLVRRHLEGTVVSAKTPKTRIVVVARIVAHQKYGKRYEVSQRYAVHDETNQSQVGDHVVIEASRPYSRTKRWRFLRKVGA